MTIRCRIIFLSTVLMALAAAVRARAALPSPVLPDGLGVNIHFTDPKPGEMEMLAAGGFSFIRMDFSWDGTERKKGEYDFSAYERLLESLDAHHIRPVFILDYHNAMYDEHLSPHTDEGRAAFAKWAAAAAVHFKGRGVLWEMYNEPNIQFWKPKPNVDDYAKLALAVGKALREAAPDETYIGPATSTIDFKFLEMCFEAGCLEYWSAVSVHPYRQNDPEHAIEEYSRLRGLIAKYAPKGKSIPILSGEWGYSAAWKGFDEDRQGKYLPRQWLVNISNDVPLSIWYDWHDDGKDPKEAEHHFGTVREDYHQGREEVYDPKPAYLAAKTLTKVLHGYRFNKRLAVGGGHGLRAGDDQTKFLMLFRKDRDSKDLMLAVWTTLPEPQTLLIPASPGPFSQTNYLGDPGPVFLDADDKGLSVIATDKVQYLHPLRPNDRLMVAAAWRRLPIEISAASDASGKQVVIPVEGENVARKPLQIVGHPTPAQAESGSGFMLTVDPGAQYKYWDGIPIRREVELSDRGVYLDAFDDAPLAQWVRIHVTNPLHVLPMPPSGGTVAIRVENPSGDVFKGRLTLVDASSGAEKDPVAPLEFAAGEFERVVRLPLTVHPAPPNAFPHDYGFAIHIDYAEGLPAFYMPRTYYRLIDDFSRYADTVPTDAYDLVADGDAMVRSDVHLSAARPPDGPPVPGVGVLELRYAFDAGWKFVRLVPKLEAARKIIGQPQALSVWVFGDGQGNLARVRFTDAAGQTFQSVPAGDPGADAIDWTGWRCLVFPLDGSTGTHWGGPSDGKVRYPIHLDTLFLLDSAGQHKTNGTLYLAATTLVEPRQ